jgi:S-(hydroxymethyl)glutathione dehydrogenase/alcohol dehydrogenase
VAVAVGIPPSREEYTVGGPAFVLNEKTLRACFYGSARLRADIPRLIDLYQGGRLLLDELVTATYPLERVNDAVAALDRGDGLRGLLVMDR